MRRDRRKCPATKLRIDSVNIYLSDIYVIRVRLADEFAVELRCRYNLPNPRKRFQQSL
jgi:hypothetical protein